MRPLPLFLCLSLCACASPAPQFFGADRQDITLDGYRFAVFHKANRAEVIRLGYLSRAERAAVPALMIRAAEDATGCTVISGSVVTGLPGDTGEAKMRLRCP